MLSGQELAKIERYMREEHRKDVEALERLKRFFPENETAPAAGSISGLQPEGIDRESGDTSTEITDLLYQHEI